MSEEAGVQYYPALKLKMGTWTYYSITMTMSEVAKKIQFSSQVSESKILNEHLQRAIGKGRLLPMMNYLAKNDERFFNSLVVASIGGTPTWRAIDLSKDEKFTLFADQFAGTFGVLSFRGTETYALDGQHRLAAIKQLISREGNVTCPTGFESETINVIFVTQPEGTTREEFIKAYRRVFSALNRYAKGTSAATNVIMDEDDRFAIVTRKMILDDEFFQWDGDEEISSKIDVESQSEAISASNEAFTTLVGFYKMNLSLLWDADLERTVGLPTGASLSQYLQLTPSDEEVEALFSHLQKIWNAIREVLPEIEKNPKDMRNNTEVNENNALFRPIIQTKILVLIARMLMNKKRISQSSNEEQIKDALEPLKHIPWSLWDDLWKDLLVVADGDPNENGIQKYKMRSEQRTQALDAGLNVLIWLTKLVDMNDGEIQEMQTEWRLALSPACDHQKANKVFEKLEQIRNKMPN